MAITISGENNNDRILAQDGVIDSISGFNIVGIITASSFTGDLTGDVTGNLTGNVTGNINNTTLLLQTGGTERLRIDSSGRLLVGTTTEGHANADDLTIATTDHTGITLRSATSRNGSVFFSDGTSGADEYRGWIQYTHTSDYLTFGTNGTEKVRIESGGRVFIGNTQDSSPYAWNLGLQVTGTSTNAGLSIRRDQSGSGGALLMFVKTGGAKNGNTAPSNNDQIGGIYFNAADGTDVNNVAARISGTVDGATGSNDTPGRLTFSTTADGANSPTERLRITSTGKVSIGNESSPLGTLHVKEGDSGVTSADTSQDTLFLESNGNAGLTIATPNANTGYLTFADPQDSNIGQIIYRHSDNSMSMFVNAAERLRIDSNGRVLIGHYSTPAAALSVAVVGSYGASSTLTPFVYLCRDEDATSIGGNESLGQILFASRDGYRGAVIEAKAGGTWSGSSSDGYLVFKTTPDNATVPTEKLRITSAGKVGIGTNNPTTYKLHLQDSTSALARFERTGGSFAKVDIKAGSTSGNSYLTFSDPDASEVGEINYEHADNSLRFNTNGGERLRITSTGQLNVAGNMQFTVGNPELEFNNGGPRFRVPAANTLTIHNGGTLGSTNNEVIRITSNKDVLIGATSEVTDTKVVIAGNVNQYNADTGTGASTKTYVLGRAYSMSTSSTNLLTFDNWGTAAFDITVFRRDNQSPAGAQVVKLYLAFHGSGTNITQASIAQENKVLRGSIHNVDFAISENNNTATLSVTGDDNGGEAQDLTFYIVGRGNGAGNIVVV